jgi:DNA topoisomerase III
LSSRWKAKADWKFDSRKDAQNSQTSFIIAFMDKTLIIAEKPSVAADIARALGGFRKKEHYYENDQYVLAAASGHLLAIQPPEGVEPKRGKWNLANLPVIPPAFDLQPIPKSESRLKPLIRLLNRKDVSALINACDAGREGELIFRYIVQYARTKKPIRRLWLQSMTAGSIREGFNALRTDEEMRPLADAAMCRSESDWLVGINGTRAMTSFNSKHGGFFLTTVGRVQTPTLMIVVEREEKIKKFEPKNYWEIEAAFQVSAGQYPGKWFDANFSRETKSEELKPERIWNEDQARSVCAKCLNQPGAIAEESKPTTQLSPLLYDLTSLQREANSRFGFYARRTLQLAQRLYEHHKVLTYPRTDARALPEDYIEVAKKTLSNLGADGQYAAFANQVLQNSWVRPNKRIFNNAKISDHFAIIPTNVLPKALSPEEEKIYDMVTKRFLAVFFPPAEFTVTTRITTVQGESFKTEGKVMVKPGWLAVYGKEAAGEDHPNLTPVQAGETALTADLKIVSQQTKPPARFSEATLLSAMEGAGKLVEDEELRAAMSAKGLGTPATRAAIIEGLIYEKYILRQGRDLVPTAKAFSLAVLLRGLKISELCSPEMTGDWEFKLKQMEQQRLGRPEFMREITSMTRAIIEKVKQSEHASIPGDFGPIKARCPKCGGEVHEQYGRFQCAACDFFLWKNLAGRQFEAGEIETLLGSKMLGPISGFHSHKGKLFAAVLRLNGENKIEFDFGDKTDDQAGMDPNSPEAKEPLGKCPACGANVFEGGSMYACEKSRGETPTCTFRSGKMILHQAIDRAQMKKLLETGKTDLLTGFISRKNRPFKAFMAIKDGKTVFEFLPRKTKERDQPSSRRSGALPSREGGKSEVRDQKSEVGDQRSESQKSEPQKEEPQKEEPQRSETKLPETHKPEPQKPESQKTGD